MADLRVPLAHEPGGVARAHHGARPLREAWPLTWWHAGGMVGTYALLVAVFTGIGALVVGPLSGSVGELDMLVAEAMVDQRTPRLDWWSHWASMLAETGVKIAATALVVVVMVAVWKRWDDSLLIALTLIVEASVFITVTMLVGRERPDVPRLDGSPVDSSFPSGHVAAAVVYGAIVVVVARHTTKRWPVALAALTVTAITLAVAWARMYRGMHHLSDVVAGVLLGLATLGLMTRLLPRGPDRRGVGSLR